MILISLISMIFALSTHLTFAQINFTTKTPLQTSLNIIVRNELTIDVEPLPCDYVPGLTVGNSTRVEECCNQTLRNFERDWSLGNSYLTTYLEKLRGWQCPQFQEECQRRLFSYTDFTKLVYDYFCEYENFVNTCYDIINETVTTSLLREAARGSPVSRSAANRTLYSEWNLLINRIRPTQLTYKDLNKPCVQVALYEVEDPHIGNFHEVVHVNLPSCEVTWCGYNGETLAERIISTWTCMSTSCRAKMISIMVICVLLGLIIAFVNILVVAVIARKPDLRHSQGIYKISLALADLIVGIIVFPTFAASLGRLTMTRHVHADIINATGYAIENGSFANVTAEIRPPAGRFQIVFTRSYLDFIGFFTLLSFTVSVYTLTVAGFDRFSAVYRPLRYSKYKAKSYAKILCVVIWAVGIFFSILPLVLDRSLSYALIASILISSGGSAALIMYSVALVIPLVIMWVVNVATFLSTKKHAKVRRHLTVDSKKKTLSVEVRLARTLCLMVSVFTLSILPSAIVLLTSLFVTSLYFTLPRTVETQGALVYNAFEFAVIIILACNSLWNFFIYNGRNLEFRREMKSLKSSVSETLGLNKFCNSCVVCCRRVAHDSRRRFSSMPTITTYSGNRKKSSASTTATKITSTSETETDTSRSHTNKYSTQRGVTNGSTTKTDNNSSLNETSSVNDTKGYKPVYKKKSNDKSTSNDSSMANDDSVFRSFVVDANADRLFLSVMENIEEEISEKPNKQENEDKV